MEIEGIPPPLRVKPIIGQSLTNPLLFVLCYKTVVRCGAEKIYDPPSPHCYFFPPVKGPEDGVKIVTTGREGGREETKKRKNCKSYLRRVSKNPNPNLVNKVVDR